MRTLVTNLLNQSGFSLPEIVISIGLLGGISLVTMNLLKEQANNEAYLKGRGEISKTINSVSAILNNPENCRFTLKDLSNAPVERTTLGTNLVGIRAKVSRPPGADIIVPIIMPNTRYPNFVTGNLTVRGSTDINDTTAFVDLEFFLQKKSSNFLASTSNMASYRANAERMVKSIPVVVKVNALNRITDCGPVISSTNSTAKQKFCESMKSFGTWNPGTETCTFNAQLCPVGQVPMIMTDMIFNCEPFQNRVDLRRIVDQTSCTNNGNGFRIINWGGRIRMDCL